jgi:outer membrane protein OmpA-like peptidoglycan-associated protein
MTNKLLLAAATIALATPALAIDDADRVVIEQYQNKIAAAKGDPAVARYSASLLNQANDALARLRGNLDDDDATSTRSNMNEIDSLVRAAKLRAQTAQAKETLELRQAQATQSRVESATARAEAAEQQARAAQQQAQAAQQQAAALQNQLRDYQLRQTQLGATLVLQDVIFETGRATLRPGAEQRLRPLVAYLQSSPNVRVRIEGHTDSRGTTAYNQNLSQTRADAVKAAIASAGIDAGRIDALGFGESRPVATNRTTAGQQANRRVEITLLGQQANQLASVQ